MKSLGSMFTSWLNDRAAKKSRAPKARKLRLEGLESRELLSVTTAEYADIRNTYAALDLPSDMSTINVIEIDAASLTADSISSAISAAAATTSDDLVVVRTTSDSHDLSAAGTFTADFDSSVYGKLTIASYGDAHLGASTSRFTFGTSADVAIAGFDFSGGTIYYPNVSISGVGVVANCDFSSTALYRTSAIRVTAGTATVDGCSFSNLTNQRNNYGSIYQSTSDSALVIKNSTFDSCTSGISTSGTSCTVDGCAFTNNEAGANVAGSGAVFTNCTFLSNEDGIYLSGQGSAQVVNCVLAKNTDSALWAASGGFVVRNCTIADNGVGLATNTENTSTPYFWDECYNTVFANNTEGDFSQDATTARASSLIVYNCVVDQPSVYFSWHNNRTVDSSAPLFVDSENNDYSIASDSQLVDVGDNTYLTKRYGNTSTAYSDALVDTTAISTDFAGNERPSNGTTDIGAYEYAAPVAAAPRVIVTVAQDAAVDHSDDFNDDGSPNLITFSDALDYVGKYYDSDTDTWVEGDASANPGVYNDDHELVSGVYTTVYFNSDVTTSGVTLASTITISQDTTIDGVDGVTISGDDSFRLFTASVGTLTLNNLTLTKGLASGSSTNGYGGAIYLCPNSSLYGDNLTFSGNKAWTYGSSSGGAIFSASNTTVSLTNSTFTNNQCRSQGGAVSNLSNGSVILTDCVFTNNEAKYGGAVSLTTNSVGTITNVEFTSNTATGNWYGSGTGDPNGGAVYVGGKSTAAFSGVTFTNNTAENFGGAIYVYDASISGDATFTGNSSTYGGAVYVLSATATLTGSYSGNTAKSGGGAVGVGLFKQNSKTYVPSPSTVVLTDSTFENNSCSNGGAIYNNGGSVTVQGESSFTENTATNGGAVYTATAVVESVEVSFTSVGAEFKDNSATNYGGAIYNIKTAAFDGDTTFDSNSAKLGGAIYNKGTLTVGDETNNASFTNNTATATVTAGVMKYGSGAAIYNSNAGSVDVTNAVFQSNTASKYGGAISNYGTLSVLTSGFYYNQAASGGAIQTAGATTLGSNYFNYNKAVRYTYTDDSGATQTAYVAEDDLGGNGGAIYFSKNASASTDVAFNLYEAGFNANYAENAGGAIDLVSGSLSFAAPDGATLYNSGAIEFSQNGANGSDKTLVGGAIVVASDVTFPSDCLFSFSDNSALYASTIAATSQASAATGAALMQGFFGTTDVDLDQYESFSRYDSTTISGGSLTYDYLYSKIDADIPTTTKIYVAQVGSGAFNVVLDGAGTSVSYETLGVTGTGNFSVRFYPEGLEDTVYWLHLSLNGGQFLAQTVATLADSSCGLVGLNLASYSGAVSKWEFNWGDGSDWDSYDNLSDSYTAYHAYPEPTERTTYVASFRVTYANGGQETFEDAISLVVEPNDSADSQDALDEEDSLDVLLTDDFVKNAFDL